MTTITLKFPGTCRDCGETILPGERAEWDRDRGVSCCATPGPVRLERITPETMEAYAVSGDSLLYQEKSYEAFAWMCPGCHLVWAKQHLARDCGGREHVTAFEQEYGVNYVENGRPVGRNIQRYTRRAIRREAK